MKKQGAILETIEKYAPTVADAYGCIRYMIGSDTLDPERNVSYKERINSKKEPEQGNEVIYLGKIFRNKIFDALCFSIGFKDKKIYSREFLQATLTYALSKIQPSVTVRIVICRVLSELFNGEPDILEQTYSLEEQKQLITLVARTSDEYNNHRLEIVSMEEMPQNEALFQRLRDCVDPETKVVNIEKAYSLDKQPDLSEQSDALQIAQFLYFAAQKNDELKKTFFKMRPSKIREQNYNEASNYYGLTEIAIRLREILSGRHIQIGADKQAVYDDVIKKILRGRKGKGKFSKIKELYPLYDLLEGKAFHTAHVRKDNSFEKKVQRNCAFTRLCIYGTLAAWVLFGIRMTFEY